LSEDLFLWQNLPSRELLQSANNFLHFRIYNTSV